MLEQRYGSRVRQAFLADIDQLRQRVALGDITALIAARQIDAAVRALGVGTTAYRTLEATIAEIFEDAGRAFTELFPRVRDPRGLQIRFGFDIRHPEAERWLRSLSSQLITGIVEDQRAAVRKALEAGLVRGDNPRRTALDIVGRMDRATGRRRGGLIGLSLSQAEWLQSARAELASADPKAMRSYLARERRDRRFDAAVRTALREGRPVDTATAQRAAERYSDRLLLLRGETIGRSETLNALRSGKHQAFVQGAEAAGVDARHIERQWDATNDQNTRPDHWAAEGQIVKGNDPFVVGGYQMRFPGDASLGAPLSQTINCRCVEIHRVDWIGRLADG